MAVFDNIFRLRSPTAAPTGPEGSTLDYVSPDASMGMFRGTMERFTPSDYLLPEGQGAPLYDPAAALHALGIQEFSDDEGSSYWGTPVRDDEGMDTWAGVEPGIMKPYDLQLAGERDTTIYADLRVGNVPAGWVPRFGNTPLPTIEEFIEFMGPGYLTPDGRVRGTTNNTPYYEYFNTFYKLPTQKADWVGELLAPGVDFNDPRGWRVYLDPVAELFGYRGGLNPSMDAEQATLLAGSLILGGGAGAAAAAGGLGTAASGAVAGGTQGATSAMINEGNVLEGALLGAAAGGLGNVAAGAAGGMFDSPWVSRLAGGAARGATGAAIYGGDIKQGITQGLLGAAPGAIGNVITDALPSSATSAPVATDSITRGMFTPISTPSSEEMLFGNTFVSEPAMMTPVNPSVMPTPLDLAVGGFVPLTGAEPTTGTEPTTMPAEEPLVTKETAQKAIDYAKTAKKIYDIYNQLTGSSGSAPEFQPPPRQEGMSDEEYRALVSAEALDYLGLDADAMRAAGYEPGTQEYLDYILAQANTIIEAAFGTDDPEALLAGESVEGLQQALRGKTEAEMQELARALYVRGALGSLTFRESAIDPFTGELEYLGTQPGEAVEGSSAAAQRGYASFLEEVGGLTGPEARQAIRGMLGRDVDLFDLGKAAKERTLQDMLAELTADASDEDEEDFDQYGRIGGRASRRGRASPRVQDDFWQQLFSGRR